jgi:hypothetical protein
VDNTVHGSASGDTNVSLYAYDGNLYYRNASGVGVKITSGSAVSTTGGSISGMSTNAEVLFSSNSYAFKFDKTLSDPGMAKMSFADIDLYKYNSSGSAAKVALKFLGSGTSAALTVPDETGTLLSTATNFAGTINIATSSSNAPIILKPHGTGHVTIGNGGATGKLTSNGAYDLILDTNGGTNSGNITIQDGTNGEITIDTHGTGDINLTAGADVNIPQDIGLVFGDDGEKIEGDGTNLTINSSALLNLSATTDVVIPVNVGLVLGDGGEKIESDNTDLTITSGVAINLNAGTLDLSAQTVDVTLNAAVDALNFDSNTLSIDASNNFIGIGLNNPSSALHISAADVAGSGTSNAQIHIRDTAAFSAAQNAGIAFEAEWQSGSFTQIAAINASRDSTSTGQYGGHLKFNIRTHGANVSEAMRITSGGDLELKTAGKRYYIPRASDGAGTGSLYSSAASTVTLSGAGSSVGKLEFIPSSTSGTAMTMDSSGNVGIGTAVPSTRLNLQYDSDQAYSSDGSTQPPTEGTIDIFNDSTTTGATAGAIRLGSGASNTSRASITGVRSASDAADLAFGTGPAGGNDCVERMRISSVGNVGIGSTDPGGPLEIFKTGTTISSNAMFIARLAENNDPMRGVSIGYLSDEQTGVIAAATSAAASNLSFWTFSGSAWVERMRIDSNGQLYTPEVYNTTTSGTANVHIHSNGYLHRSTSSIKYKKDVETLEDSYANKILDLRPVWFRSKCKTDKADWSHWGLIAEEVGKVDPRLVHWKTEEKIKKENPETGLTESETVVLDPPEAEGVQYERLIPHFINILKRMDARIKILEGA